MPQPCTAPPAGFSGEGSAPQGRCPQDDGVGVLRSARHRRGGECGRRDRRHQAAGGLRHQGRVPVVRLVNALLSDAVRRRASDVHFEPEHEFLRIRYRIDGVLRQIRSLCATTRNLSVWTVFLWFEIRTELLWMSVSATATCCFSRQCPLPRWAHLPSSRVSRRFHHSVGLRVARGFSTTQRLTRVSVETPPVRASVSSRAPARDRE